ncbi:glutathione S-transferase family protein [Hyphococcus sp.]|uniref:glutathione S-transferase family protein n=1 Tax=Hyphococcus sp. TaxID=2038636 RepID=UPI003CCB9588
MTDEIFLHHYDASPFSQKAIKLLAIKQAQWRSVIHPMIAPKPELTALTGGYRGTPVMQIGADIYIDAQLIAEELERRLPSPTIYPGGKGLAHMLSDWGEAYFRAGLDIAIRELSGDWPEDFYKDRDQVFPDLDFSKAEARFPAACARLRAQARFIDDQLSDGRAFLMGDAPGLADIQSYVVNWFTRGGFPFVSDLFADFEYVKPWEERMAALGEGERQETEIETAYDAAKNARATVEEEVDINDPLEFRIGDTVIVAPETSQRGAARGRLMRLTATEIVIAPSEAAIDGIAVHYPRLGYTIAHV